MQSTSSRRPPHSFIRAAVPIDADFDARPPDTGFQQPLVVLDARVMPYADDILRWSPAGYDCRMPLRIASLLLISKSTAVLVSSHAAIAMTDMPTMRLTH